MLKITKHGFASIPLDNDRKYIDFVTISMKHSDPEAEVTLNKCEKDIKVRVTPSQEKFKQHIIDNLLAVHRLFRIKIIFSKSLAAAKSISYLVEI